MQAVATPGEDLSALCLQADVFFGDSQLGPASVRTSTQHSAPDAEASVRIQTTVPVNEPVVSVLVKAGCTSPFSRRYVLLADFLSEPAAVPQATQNSQASPAPSPGALDASQALPPLAPGSGGGSLRAVPASGAGAARAATPSGQNRNALPTTTPSRPKPDSVVRKPVAPARDLTPRLQLDPVDVSLAIERDPVLRLSLSLLSEPASNEQERAAAAQLWKALNAAPEDILRDAQKLAVLEAESKGLREQEARNKAAMLEMEARVEQSRLMSWAAYALGALLLLALAALAWLWRRKGQAAASGATPKDWWASGAVKAPAVKAGASGSAKGVDLDLDLDVESGLDELRSLREGSVDSGVVPLPASERREFRASQMGVSRSVATEELFDVQQQSDFFVSLGEFDQAIGVLKTHLSESQEPSALAYLDLFKLYHRMGRRDDYGKLREEFNRQFNASAPPFDQYSDASLGLEAYEAAFGRIQALWPQPKVLDVIEKSIFRDAADPESEVFDLEAYRELLLLHAIAKEVIQRDSSGPTSDFQHTAIRPLKAAGQKAAAAGAVAERLTEPLDDIPHASPRLGLDVDLDALQEASAFEASLPDVAVAVEPSAKPAPPPGMPVAEELGMGNLIDFEVLDFVPPDEPNGDKGTPPK